MARWLDPTCKAVHQAHRAANRVGNLGVCQRWGYAMSENKGSSSSGRCGPQWQEGKQRLCQHGPRLRGQGIAGSHCWRFCVELAANHVC